MHVWLIFSFFLAVHAVADLRVKRIKPLAESAEFLDLDEDDDDIFVDVVNETTVCST